MIKKYLDELNEKQVEAVKHYKGPCMVYAGPGSGKTTVITHRIGYLINEYNVDPSKILVISFTKSAADEMKFRFEESYSRLIKGRSTVNFGTFHSTFFRILRGYHKYDLGSILNEGEKYNVIRNIVKTLQVGNHLEDEFIKDVILDIGLLNSNILDRDSFVPTSMSLDDFSRVVFSYENYKKDFRKIDFDDMLTKCYDLLVSQPTVLQKIRNSFEFILIDEFQDINSVQYEIIKLIASPRENLFVVGDDDQSIYSFRGANPNFILEFDKNYKETKKVLLNLNYRSPENIIKIANSLISNNNLRVEKSMMPTKDIGVEVGIFSPPNKEVGNNELSELVFNLLKEDYSYNDIAIIYRTNILANSVVDAFLDNNIPFSSREQIYNIFEHWMAKDILGYLESAMNINDRDAIKRIINRPTRYITNKAMKAADEYHKDYITSLKAKGDLMPYQNDYLNRLEVDLKNLAYLEVKDAIVYVRQKIGYDDYIRSYCLEKQISSDGLFEILDEIEELATKHITIPKFIKHVSDFEKSIYENKKYNTSVENRVELLTMHSAKGLEYKVVIIVEALEEIIPHSRSIKDENIEEERRLFYVAVTRAKERLYIYCPLTRYGKKSDVSRFVKELKILEEKKSKFKKGQEVIHRVFGKGSIESINSKMLKVKFYKTQAIKELDIDICMENGLISTLN